MASSNTASSPAPPKPPKVLKEVVFYTYPKLVFAWPLILVGYLFPFIMLLDGITWVPPLLGWAYVFTTLMVIMTMGIDLDRNLSVFWLVLVLLVIISSLYLNTQDIHIVDALFGWLGNVDVNYDNGLGLLVSLLLTPPYLLMIFWTRINHKWRMTHNEFEHYAWGRADDSLARGAKRVRSTFPDWLEFMLLGAGTLIVYSATGQKELRRIPHVPFIRRVRKKINLLLESTQVTLDGRDQAILEEIESSEEEETGARTEDSVQHIEGIGSEKDPL